MMDRGTAPKHVDFLYKIKFGKLVRLLVLLDRNLLSTVRIQNVDFLVLSLVVQPVKECGHSYEYIRNSRNENSYISFVRLNFCYVH